MRINLCKLPDLQPTTIKRRYFYGKFIFSLDEFYIYKF